MLSLLAIAAAWSRPTGLNVRSARAAPRLAPAVGTLSPPSELPGRLLSIIEGTDRGVAVSEESREEINGMIETLEASWVGTECARRPFAHRITRAKRF